MKKILPSLISVVLVCILVGCSDKNEDPSNFNEATYSWESSLINDIYSLTTDSLEANALEISKKLNFISTRKVSNESISGSTLIERIVTLKPSDFNISELELNINSEEQFSAENYFWEALCMLTSQDKANELENFIDSYIDMGAHNPIYLSNSVQHQPIIIKVLMITFAAKADYYIPKNPQTRISGGYCINWLYREAIKWVRVDEYDVILEILGSIELGVLDPVAGLVSAGIDVYSALTIANGYNQCTLLHGSL